MKVLKVLHPAIVVMNAFLMLLNGLAAVFAFVHHRPAVGAINLLMIGLIVGCLLCALRQKNELAMLQARQLLERDLLTAAAAASLRVAAEPDSQSRAAQYLERIVRITKARKAKDGLFASLTIRDLEYVVTNRQVYLLRDGQEIGRTCYTIAEIIPDAEHIASALLLLFNDPSCFGRWHLQAYGYGHNIEWQMVGARHQVVVSGRGFQWD